MFLASNTLWPLQRTHLWYHYQSLSRAFRVAGTQISEGPATIYGGPEDVWRRSGVWRFDPRQVRHVPQFTRSRILTPQSIGPWVVSTSRDVPLGPTFHHHNLCIGPRSICSIFKDPARATKSRRNLGSAGSRQVCGDTIQHSQLIVRSLALLLAVGNLRLTVLQQESLIRGFQSTTHLLGCRAQFPQSYCPPKC